MPTLNSIEKKKLEKLFINSGYVLDFSNRTFQEFFRENFNIDIYAEKYGYLGDSKGNRLRAFWEKELSNTVSASIFLLLDYWQTNKTLSSSNITTTEQLLYDECKKIAERLKRDIPVEHIDSIKNITNDSDVDLLVKSIKDSIEKMNRRLL